MALTVDQIIKLTGATMSGGELSVYDGAKHISLGVQGPSGFKLSEGGELYVEGLAAAEPADPTAEAVSQVLAEQAAAEDAAQTEADNEPELPLGGPTHSAVIVDDDAAALAAHLAE